MTVRQSHRVHSREHNGCIVFGTVSIVDQMSTFRIISTRIKYKANTCIRYESAIQFGETFQQKGENYHDE